MFTNHLREFNEIYVADIFFPLNCIIEETHEKLKICLEMAKHLCFLIRLVVGMRDQIIKSGKIR